MTANTGRTTFKWTQFKVDDSGATLREIPVSSINGCGLDYEMKDLTAFCDAVKGSLPGMPSDTITITGPFDTSAASTTVSGSHTVLYNLPGGVTPLALGIFIGVRHTWEAGEWCYGITGTTSNGFLCKSYIPDVNNGTYSATFEVAAGSAIPAWSTTAIT